jgi:hypothetical protein
MRLLAVAIVSTFISTIAYSPKFKALGRDSPTILRYYIGIVLLSYHDLKKLARQLSKSVIIVVNVAERTGQNERQKDEQLYCNVSW